MSVEGPKANGGRGTPGEPAGLPKILRGPDRTWKKVFEFIGSAKAMVLATYGPPVASIAIGVWHALIAIVKVIWACWQFAASKGELPGIGPAWDSVEPMPPVRPVKSPLTETGELKWTPSSEDDSTTLLPFLVEEELPVALSHAM